MLASKALAFLKVLASEALGFEKCSKMLAAEPPRVEKCSDMFASETPGVNDILLPSRPAVEKAAAEPDGDFPTLIGPPPDASERGSWSMRFGRAMPELSTASSSAQQ